MTHAFKTTLAGLTGCLLALTAPSAAMASVSDIDFGVTTLEIILPVDTATYDQMARRGRGADDPAGHIRRGRGADDPAGHVRGGGKRRGRGADDGPRHTWVPLPTDAEFARRGRGADDPAGHVRGGGKGRGKDDAPNHG